MLVEGRAGSVGELLAEVDRICRTFKTDFNAREEIWFRGQPHRHWSLQPRLYRSPEARYHYDEPSLNDRFVTLATPLVTRSYTEWEWYFLARHHGLPSRLLDWTESLLGAVYFALEPHCPPDRLRLDELLEQPPVGPRYDDGSPSVWILDAGSLNRISIGLDQVVVTGGERSRPYLPRELEQGDNGSAELPIAIMPPRGNARLAAQQGMFTLHGRRREGIETLADRPELRLGIVALDQSRIARFLDELRRCGVHRLGLFPDLDSVVHHVCWVSQSTT